MKYLLANARKTSWQAPSSYKMGLVGTMSLLKTIISYVIIHPVSEEPPMKKRWKLLIAFTLIVAGTILFLSFFSIFFFPSEVNKPLKIPGETYFLVRKPGIFKPVYVNVGKKVHGIVWGSLLNVFTGRGVELPWYFDEDYISVNAFFCYNTKHGIITDRDFFNR